MSEDLWQKVYSDSENGALDFLLAVSVLKSTQFTKVYPDPVVQGVWKITGLLDTQTGKMGHEAIVYLAGYKNPGGDIRKRNDFECSDYEVEV